MINWEPFIIASDLHGDEQDPIAVKALRRHIADTNPTIRVFAGDLWDLRPLRRKASPDEKRDKICLDLQMGNEWLADFKPTVFIRGNHDERLWDLAKAGNGPLSELAQQTINLFDQDLKKMGCKVHLPWDKRHGVYKMGHLNITHGFKSGVNAAREMARAYGNVVFGHNHYPQYVSIEGLEPRIGVGLGCLCNLDMEYLKASIRSLAHNHGWASGVINKRNGQFKLWPVESVNSKFMVITGFKEIQVWGGLGKFAE